MFAFTLALKLNLRSRLSSKRPPISHYITDFVSTCNSVQLPNVIFMYFPFNINRITSSNSVAICRANKCHREDKSSSQKKHSFTSRHLKHQTKHILTNVEYFKKCKEVYLNDNFRSRRLLCNNSIIQNMLPLNLHNYD